MERNIAKKLNYCFFLKFSSKFICFTCVIQLMMCLTAIQQRSELHKGFQDAAGTCREVSTPDRNDEGSKLYLGGKQLPGSGNTSVPHFL